MSREIEPAPDAPVAWSLPSVGWLARALEAAYGLAGVRCQLIKATVCDTYRVWSDSGSFVLRIYRHGAHTRQEIDAELDMLEHLAAHNLAVASAVPLTSGGRLLALTAPEGGRYAVLFPYLAGKQLSKATDVETARRFGCTVARLHLLTDAAPFAASRPLLDFAELVERSLAAFARATDRPEHVEYLTDVVALLRDRFASLPTTGPAWGFVHGDLIPSNTLVLPDGRVALLDFDFCGTGWRAYDIATYLSEVAYWQASQTVAESFVAGYEEVRPLEAVERDALPLLEAARNIVSLGVPAAHVNLWGSAYLNGRLTGTLIASIEQCVARTT